MSAARIDEGNNDGEDGVDDDRGEDLGNDDDNASFGGDGKIEYDVIDRVTMIPISFSVVVKPQIIDVDGNDLKKFLEVVPIKPQIRSLTLSETNPSTNPFPDARKYFLIIFFQIAITFRVTTTIDIVKRKQRLKDLYTLKIGCHLKLLPFILGR